ncbi:MAG: hypothetical protein WEB31_08025 [Chthoniobacterales bacterium]
MSTTPGQPQGLPFRPPHFFLPRKLHGSDRARGDGAQIFLSWDETIYGPASAEEVMAGLRANWFEDEALFWFAGQTDWRPVDEFPTVLESVPRTLVTRRPGAEPPATPPLPPASGEKSSHPRRRRRHHRKEGAKSPRRGTRHGRTGRRLVFGVILLAAVVTVALIFLLMQV